MFQHNKLSDFQYARFQILIVHLHFGLFWSASIPAVMQSICSMGTAHYLTYPALTLMSQSAKWLYVCLCLASHQLPFLAQVVHLVYTSSIFIPHYMVQLAIYGATA